MGLLSTCWLMIEFYIIPHGFLKWFYLSFYIHPSILFFCQIFLWLKKFQRWFLILFFFPFRIYHFLISLFISLFSLFVPKTRKVEVFYDCDQILCNGSQVNLGFDAHGGVIFTSSRFDLKSNYSYNHLCMMDTVQVINRDPRCIFKSSRLDSDSQYGHNMDSTIQVHGPSEIKEEMDHFRESWLDEYLSSDHYTSSLVTYDNDQESIDDELEDCEVAPPYSFSTVDHDHDHGYLTTICGYDSPMGALEQEYLISKSVEKDVDTFQEEYEERIRFFDALYHERFYGMTSILNEHLTSPRLSQSTESSIDFSTHNMSWSSMVRKKILRSLEHDFELIYVAQTCLLWEALHHQYQKVEGLLLCNNSENRIFNTNISGKFQEFQILLVRFMEDQKSLGQGSSSCTHKKISFQSLLEVPKVTGYMEEENVGIGGEAIRVAQVLKAIWKCIKAFWLYVNIDNKKSLWKYKGIFRTHPPIEDPKDLELLYQVTKALHKKMILLKDLQGKKKCWLRRKVEPLQAEDEKRSVLFAKMDMKLVQKLLKMSMISASHLNWCNEKLNNLEFRDGKLFRAPTCHVFPSS